MLCEYCQLEYTQKRKDQKYCSHKCKYRKRRFRTNCANDRRRHWKRNNINITIEQYQSLLHNQQELCKICGTHQSNIKQRLAVDHNHSTGKIRGLLCGSCNQGLGFFKDNPQILQKAIEYLQS